VGARLPHRYGMELVPTHLRVQWVPGLLLGVKLPGRGVDQPPPFSAEFKERVELFFFSPSEPSCPELGCNLPVVHFSETLLIYKSVLKLCEVCTLNNFCCCVLDYQFLLLSCLIIM
jgi:hypothetical protein